MISFCFDKLLIAISITYHTYNLISDISSLSHIFKSLHEHKVDMNQRDHGGRTALHFAANGNYVETVKFLIHEAKVDISVSDR